MVRFRDLVGRGGKVDPTDLKQLFDSLDRHASHTELRPAQSEAVRSLTERRGERDLVLKISTGAGKTAVALTYLQSYMEETEGPVVYLCPTIQLVEQVCEEGAHLGIKAVSYLGGKTHPDPEAMAGHAVLVCTYSKLFNAKTTFDRSDVMLRPHAIVLDDAHAGVEEIRDAFTLKAQDPDTIERLLALFRAPCSAYRPGLWQDVENGDPFALMEVPFWIWRPMVGEVRGVLSEDFSNGKFIFVWPWLRDMLERCRCVVSGGAIEILPDILPINIVTAYAEAPHRLYASATLADDSVLVRELDCDPAAALCPIRPESDRGLGERMVLAPSLIDDALDRSAVMQVCKTLAKHYNVVVLCASETAARDWEDSGAQIFMKDDVAHGVRLLRDPAFGIRFAAFAQRYDGLDLPDDSCRILVIDGMPFGEGVADRYDSSVSGIIGGVRNRLVYRLEQGMGRAVRSHVDYAVVLLCGPELSSFVARREVRDTMNADSSAQLRLALDLAKLAAEDGAEPRSALLDMIRQALSRDAGWKQYYDENVRQASQSTSPQPDEVRVRVAAAERQAFESRSTGDVLGGIRILQTAIDDSGYEGKEKGWYLQKLAAYTYDLDPGRALEIQQSAYSHSHDFIRPPTILKRPPATVESDPRSTMLSWFSRFENGNGAVAAIEALQSKLNFAASAETVEQALLDLAEPLGAAGFRPEKEFGEGPDDLWLWPEHSFVIEAKTRKEATLSRQDGGQMLRSLEWFRRNYATRGDPIPVVASDTTLEERGAQYPGSTRVLTQDGALILMEKLKTFYRRLASETPIFLQPRAIGSIYQEFGLAPERLLAECTVPLKTRK